MSALAPILAVDDSAPIREMILAVLAGRGLRVVTAADGQEALERLRTAAEPYIVLLDIVMPVMDGLQLCAEIEKDATVRAAGHQIILMSSTMRLNGQHIPVVSAYLNKPFTRQQLIEVVTSAQQAIYA
ncbi:MAG TPA: response regulator [Ktedonobacterales bacterium]|nr:response regulator [Ktedonobacterales bacterium]